MLKDARLALDVAEKASLYLPVTQTVGDVLSSSRGRRLGRGGFRGGRAGTTICPRSVVEEGGPVEPSTDSAEALKSIESASVSPVAASAPEPAPDTVKEVEPPKPLIADAPSEPKFLPPPPDPNKTKKSTLRIIREFFKPDGTVQK